MGGQVKNEGAIKVLDIVGYASEMSVNGVICVFVVHLRSSDTYESL